MTFFNAYDNLEIDSRLVSWSNRHGVTFTEDIGKQKYIEVLASDADSIIGTTFELPVGKSGFRSSPRRRTTSPKSYKIMTIKADSKGKVFLRDKQEFVRLYGENSVTEIKE